ECACVLLPAGLVEVHGKEPAGLVLEQRVDADDMLPLQVVGDNAVADGDEGLVGALPALDARFLADASHPLVGARGGVALLRGLIVDPQLWEDVGPTSKKA